ncbi:MAG: hypothetical protein HRT94_06680 [Alphaproteobacteria bacterium]|nr:hypothetical protein [Alphaproteobacteria bacterium]
MKYLLALLSLVTLFGASTAQAQTPVSKEIANNYFINCKSQTDPRFSAASQEIFCACTAANMVQSYTLEDMQNASRPDEIGRAAANKLIINVYAPCIQFPAREYHYNSCVQNPQTKILGGDPQKLCACTAERVAAHIQQNAQSMFSQILAVNPTIADPMQALYSDNNFQKTAQAQLMACLGR